ncbi:hypothetical protein F5Y19DRAFT_462502 [Xylariaceae sp. FL1651]|nr:hypothetical protein F5Y19DRAFT_462502 [Xylariaceae sp. FL1651]
MVVILTLPPPTEPVWYLAYGSNLASSKFVSDRGIVPKDVRVVSIRGFTLAMDSAGFPYSEPSFASIRPLDMNAYPKEIELLGTAYLVSPEQYTRIIASEGGGIAYREAEVQATVIQGNTEKLSLDAASQETMIARSLITVIVRRPDPRPSARYLKLITEGAAEAKYPEYYQQYLKSLFSYHPPTRVYRRFGAWIFLSLWVPIMALMEKLTKISIRLKGDKQGTAPDLVIWLVRTMMLLMWWHHDRIHAPIWGRGDGLDQPVQI